MSSELLDYLSSISSSTHTQAGQIFSEQIKLHLQQSSGMCVFSAKGLRPNLATMLDEINNKWCLVIKSKIILSPVFTGPYLELRLKSKSYVSIYRGKLLVFRVGLYAHAYNFPMIFRTTQWLKYIMKVICLACKMGFFGFHQLQYHHFKTQALALNMKINKG